MLKRENARTDLLERSLNSADDRPKPVLNPWQMIRQLTNQPLRRERASGGLILDAIAQRLSPPKGRDHRSLICTKTSQGELIEDPVVQFSSAEKVEYAKETCKIPCGAGAALHGPPAAVQKSTSLKALECRLDHVDDTVKSILSELQVVKKLLIAL
jgi:hypothetical protein